MTDHGGDSKGFASRFARSKSFAKKELESRGGGEAPSGKFAKLLDKDKEDKKSVPFSEEKSVLRSSRSSSEGFAKAAKKSRIDCLFLVRGKDKGRAAWHYVLVDKSKKEMFLAKSRSGSMDVALYGEILYSGWGENPPEEVVKKIEEEFGA